MADLVRLAFMCECGAHLVTEARQSGPYTWDYPWSMTCRCQRVHGIKLTHYSFHPVPMLSVVRTDDFCSVA